MSFVLVWEFQAKPGMEKEFEKQYGATGDWCKLFRSWPSFQRTELVRDSGKPDRYITLDYWSSQKDFDEFRQANQHQYESIDRDCETLSLSEKSLGSFITIEDD